MSDHTQPHHADIAKPETFGTVFSDCQRFRFTLYRKTRGTSLALTPTLTLSRVMVGIGLNPSTADAVNNDPTIRRIIGFAEREDCGHLIMCNLFAYRATDPKEMERAHRAGVPIVGARNIDWIQRAVACAKQSGGIVFACWGSHEFATGRFHTPIKDLLQWISAQGAHCIGHNANGSPGHPLYAPGKAVMVPWDIRPRSRRPVGNGAQP